MTNFPQLQIPVLPQKFYYSLFVEEVCQIWSQSQYFQGDKTSESILSSEER